MESANERKKKGVEAVSWSFCSSFLLSLSMSQMVKDSQKKVEDGFICAAARLAAHVNATAPCSTIRVATAPKAKLRPF